MPIPVSLANLLAGNVVEHERIEFKEGFNAISILKTICAFANDLDDWGGGYLVIGVKQHEDGSLDPVGVPAEKLDLWQKELLNKCMLISPNYIPIVDVATYAQKQFIVIWAPGGSVRPYSCPTSLKQGSSRAYYVRKMASTIKASEVMARELFSLSNNVPYDDRPNHFASIGDLDISLMRQFLKETGSGLYDYAAGMSVVELAKYLHLVEGPDELLMPKNVGLLFFSSNPERYFPYARIDIVEFPEGLGGDTLIEHVFEGPLHHQITNALQYLRSNVIEEHVQKLPDSAHADRWFNYPFAAVEESLVNAVYHKGYDVREPVEVRVFPDRMEIVSYPGADRSISQQALETYRVISRRYRNRRIGEFLKELRLTEGRNTGLSKIVRSLRQNGSPDPLFETDEERLYFAVTLYARQAQRTPQLDSAPSGLKVLEVTQRQWDVTMFLLNNSHATSQELAVQFGVSVATMNRDLKALKDFGAIQRVGARKNGAWQVVKTPE